MYHTERLRIHHIPVVPQYMTDDVRARCDVIAHPYLYSGHPEVQHVSVTTVRSSRNVWSYSGGGLVI